MSKRAKTLKPSEQLLNLKSSKKLSHGDMQKLRFINILE